MKEILQPSWQRSAVAWLVRSEYQGSGWRPPLPHLPHRPNRTQKKAVPTGTALEFNCAP